MTFTLLQLIIACCISAAIPTVCLTAYFRREFNELSDAWAQDHMRQDDELDALIEQNASSYWRDPVAWIRKLDESSPIGYVTGELVTDDGISFGVRICEKEDDGNV